MVYSNAELPVPARDLAPHRISGHTPAGAGVCV